MKVDVLQFPSVELRSQAEFQDFVAANQFTLDRRYEYECSLGSRASEIVAEGTCGACLQPTRFRSNCASGDALPDGRRVPHWRESMICDCDFALNNRQRALLHLLQAKLGMNAWSRVLALGGSDRAFDALAQAVGSFRHQPRMMLAKTPPRDPVLPGDPASADIFLSLEYAHHVPDIDGLFRQAARLLVPGGAMVLSAPFYFSNETTQSLAPPSGADRCESGQALHQLGWDILARICYAGFADSWIEIFWSEEFGYLGPFNALLVALKD